MIKPSEAYRPFHRSSLHGPSVDYTNHRQCADSIGRKFHRVQSARRDPPLSSSRCDYSHGVPCSPPRRASRCPPGSYHSRRQRSSRDREFGIHISSNEDDRWLPRARSIFSSRVTRTPWYFRTALTSIRDSCNRARECPLSALRFFIKQAVYRHESGLQKLSPRCAVSLAASTTLSTNQFSHSNAASPLSPLMHTYPVAVPDDRLRQTLSRALAPRSSFQASSQF